MAYNQHLMQEELQNKSWWMDRPSGNMFPNTAFSFLNSIPELQGYPQKPSGPWYCTIRIWVRHGREKYDHKHLNPWFRKSDLKQLIRYQRSTRSLRPSNSDRKPLCIPMHPYSQPSEALLQMNSDHMR